MRIFAVSAIAVAFGLLGCALAMSITGFFEGTDWLYLLAGSGVSSLLLWFTAACLIRSRSRGSYMLVGVVSPLIGFPIAAFFAVTFYGGIDSVGRLLSNISGAFAYSIYLVPIASFLIPFGILMGWISGKIMVPDKAEDAS